MFSSRFEEAVCAEDGMDVLNALNFKEENLALDMILLGALAVGFRDDDIYLHMINVLPRVGGGAMNKRSTNVSKSSFNK